MILSILYTRPYDLYFKPWFLTVLTLLQCLFIVSNVHCTVGTNVCACMCDCIYISVTSYKVAQSRIELIVYFKHIFQLAKCPFRYHSGQSQHFNNCQLYFVLKMDTDGLAVQKYLHLAVQNFYE